MSGNHHKLIILQEHEIASLVSKWIQYHHHCMGNQSTLQPYLCSTYLRSTCLQSCFM